MIRAAARKPSAEREAPHGESFTAMPGIGPLVGGEKHPVQLSLHGGVDLRPGGLVKAM